MSAHKTAPGLAQVRELAQRAVGEHDWPGQLGDDLLHGLANPPRGVRPERGAQIGVVALQRPKHADDPLLHELGAIDAGRVRVDARDAADKRHERLDQPGARARAVAACRAHEIALGLAKWDQLGSGLPVGWRR